MDYKKYTTCILKSLFVFFFLKEKMRFSFSSAVILAPFKNIIISCSFN